MESIRIENKEGRQLAGYLFLPESEPRLLLIVCHGFRGAKENGGKIWSFADRVNMLGIGLLAFDFSGSGHSEGDFSTMTLSRQADDLQCVIDYLHKLYNLPLVLLGRSFGGSTVIAGGAHDERVKGYILWSTPVFLAETFAAMIPDEYQSLQAGQAIHIKDEAGEFDMGYELIQDFGRHDMEEYLQAISLKPVLIIHAQDDELVPAENAVYVHSKLSNAQLFIVEQAGHRFQEKTELRENITLDWLQKNM